MRKWRLNLASPLKYMYHQNGKKGLKELQIILKIIFLCIKL